MSYYYYIINSPSQAQIDAAIGDDLRVSTSGNTLLKTDSNALLEFAGETVMPAEQVSVELLKTEWEPDEDGLLLKSWQERAKQQVALKRRGLEEGGIPWQGDILQSGIESKFKLRTVQEEGYALDWKMQSNNFIHFEPIDFQVAAQLMLAYTGFIYPVEKTKQAEIDALTNAHAVWQWLDEGHVETGWDYDFVVMEAAIRASILA